jgi:hypothetical protein
MGGASWAAVAVVAAATLGGARFAGVFRHSRPAALRLAAAALLAVVALDLAPDVVRDVAETRSAHQPIGATCVVAFGIAAVAARWACACGPHPTTTTGLAIAVHRALEGAALVLAGSADVVIALVLHAAGEGFALQTHDAARAGRVRLLLGLACLSPAVGAAALGDVELPVAATPIVSSLVAGALISAAARMISAARAAPARSGLSSTESAVGHSVAA